MITTQDLELLERLHTPIGKILREHLRADHNYVRGTISGNPLKAVNEQQAKKIQTLLAANSLLEDEVKELVDELASLNVDYTELRELREIREICNKFVYSI